MSTSLDCLFRPRSVAVIGASRQRGTIGGEIFHNMLASGFSGPVYPINPHAPVVQSVRAYASLHEVPDKVELAIIVVPQHHVLKAIDDCISKDVRGVVIISAGFAETGASGRELQNEIVRRCRDSGIRLVGPNCLGILNSEPEFNLNATFAPTWPPHGSVAFSSQSGALGLAILDYAKELGIGVSHFASVGNKADVSGNDLIEYWEDDPHTRVILLYLESFGNPQRFMEIARRASRKKPIIAVKSGRTEAGARAASSHTGALAGLDVAVDALLGQAGVLRTNTIEELFDVAMLLANQPVPQGRRVAVLTNAGGPGIMAADACESHGLAVATPSEETVRALREILPSEASVKNPIDMIASASPEAYERALRLLQCDPRFDAIIVLYVPPIVTNATDIAAAIRRAATGCPKPVLTCFLGTHGVPTALSSLREGRFPSYAFPEAAAIALARAVRYGEWLARPPFCLPSLSGVNQAAGAHVLDQVAKAGGPDGWLGPEETRALLAAYGISMPASAVAHTSQEAVEAARHVGYPVAVKLVSATLTHKTEVGGVVLDLEDDAAVAQAFATITARLEKLGEAGAMQGVLVQKMLPQGVETFVGMTHDKAFGPLVGFGTGGVSVELWRDVAFRVAPLCVDDARDMLDEIRGKALLDGFRGGPQADKDALVDAILRVGQLAGDLPAIRELDINPLLALAPGHGVVALDARVRVGTGLPGQ